MMQKNVKIVGRGRANYSGGMIAELEWIVAAIMAMHAGIATACKLIIIQVKSLK
jgi:hypothetical protein